MFPGSPDLVLAGLVRPVMPAPMAGGGGRGRSGRVRRPQPARWAPDDERRALALAVEFLGLTLLSPTFSDHCAPVQPPGCYELCGFARRRLERISGASPAIRRVVRALDWEQAGEAMNQPGHVRGRIMGAARRISGLARKKAR